MTELSIALVCVAVVAWDAWRRYLRQVDRLDQLKRVEAGIAARFKAIEAALAQHQRAIGIRALAQAKTQQATAEA